MPASKAEFDAAYKAHQSPEVRNLMSIEDETTAESAAIALAAKGYRIDVPIMVWRWSAFWTMTMREQYGYTWVPALGGQPVTLAPGLSFPGYAAYDAANPPAGSIPVSTKIEDYPPFPVPPAPANPPAPVENMVGRQIMTGMFEALWPAPQKFLDGQVAEFAGTKYAFHRPSTFGRYWWTLA